MKKKWMSLVIAVACTSAILFPVTQHQIYAKASAEYEVINIEELSSDTDENMLQNEESTPESISDGSFVSELVSDDMSTVETDIIDNEDETNSIVYEEVEETDEAEFALNVGATVEKNYKMVKYVASSFILNATSGNVTGISGTLPKGVSYLSSSHELYGVPTESGRFSFDITTSKGTKEKCILDVVKNEDWDVRNLSESEYRGMLIKGGEEVGKNIYAFYSTNSDLVFYAPSKYPLKNIWLNGVHLNNGTDYSAAALNESYFGYGNFKITLKRTALQKLKNIVDEKLLDEFCNYGTGNAYDYANTICAEFNKSPNGDIRGEYFECYATNFYIVEENISIENASISGVSLSYGYSGKAYTPNLTVKVDGVTLIKDTDYTVKYENNVKPGTATIIVTGKGNYTGSRTKTFEIVDCVSSIVSGKTYQLIPKNNSRTAVSSFGGRMVNNTKVYITDRSSSEAMRFKAVKNSDGTWKFINAKCELALAVQQNSSALGAGLVLYDQTTRKAQNWKLSKKSDNSFAIMNAVTGYSIAMSDASASRGTTLSMAETASSGLQRFYLAEISGVNAPFDGTKSVRATKDKTFGLNIASASKADGANVNLYKYSNANEKKFKILYSGGGYYRLVNVNSGLCLTVKNDSSADGANVIQSKWAAKNGQRWRIKKNSDETVTLTNAKGTVLHLVGNATKNGTNIVAKKAASTKAQRWYLG